MVTRSEAIAIALRYHKAGQLQAAESIYRQILAVEPNEPDVLHLLGVLAHQTGRHEEAAALIGRAIALKGTDGVFHNNLGNVLKAQGKPDDAVSSYRRALEFRPDYAEAYNNLGAVLQIQGNIRDAVACYRRTVELKPDRVESHNNLGVALNELGNRDDAIASFARALELKPDYAEVHNNLGNVFQVQGKIHRAIASYQHALQLNPDYPQAYINLGSALRDQGELNEALRSFRKAAALRPNDAETCYGLGIVLRDQGKLDEAVGCFHQCLALKPDCLPALGALVHLLQHICHWDGLGDLVERIIDIVERNTVAAALPPFTFLTLPTPTTPRQQFLCARQWVDRQLKAFAAVDRMPMHHSTGEPKAKITVGYLSGDFHSHATAWLIAELFEKHDRECVVIHGYSYGVDDRSPMRRRLTQAFDRFVDVQPLSFEEAARQITADGVDILVDLKGYTADSRTQILAHRPAPIQVSYLGYPGTMGASFIDYILVDDFVVSNEQQPFFSERLIHLPECYQVNDSQREIATLTPSRDECGLPTDGFIFCCFNNSYKITPEIFDVWMRLLLATPGSALWLLEGNRFAAANLRREAESRGVAANRLVFARRLPLPEHLARHRLADLFLDTFPVNAHTTASDALWAGCPVLTLAGESFVSRVAGSLLRTLGLPEFITTSLLEYEGKALHLAHNREILAELRTRLAANRATSRLFDAGRFARAIEKAYVSMWNLKHSRPGEG